MKEDERSGLTGYAVTAWLGRNKLTVILFGVLIVGVIIGYLMP